MRSVGRLFLVLLLFAVLSVGCAASTSGRDGEKFRDDSVQNAMESIAGRLALVDPMMVAVLPFVERGRAPTLLGEYAAEKFMAALTVSRRVGVVERTRLDEVRREQRLGASGEIDDATAASIGNLLGANAVAVGVLTKAHDDWEVSVRLVGTSDGRVLGMADARFAARSVPDGVADVAAGGTTGPADKALTGAEKIRRALDQRCVWEGGADKALTSLEKIQRALDCRTGRVWEGGADKALTPSKLGEAVRRVTKKPLSAALATGSRHMEQKADSACSAEDVGKCGCLPEDLVVRGLVGYYSPKPVGPRYDVACCHDAGDSFTIYSCSDGHVCDDASGATVVCVRSR